MVPFMNRTEPALEFENPIELKATSDGKPLGGALLFLVAKKRETGEIIVHAGVGDELGSGSLSFDPETEDPFYVSAMAAEGTWYSASQDFTGPVLLECPPIEFQGNIEWWHRFIGIDHYDIARGDGISIGMVDTGVGPHCYLSHIRDLGGITNGVPSSDGADASYHGTMVAGLIGARPTDPHHPAGVAPGAALMSVRVSSGSIYSSGEADVAAAIKRLADEGADLINLSFSRDSYSAVQAGAIAYAYMRGSLCIASAGNESAPPVRYPAKLPGVVAVGGVGVPGLAPTNETNAVFRPSDPALQGKEGVYLSIQSCYGNEITCVAPGLAVLSTVASPAGGPLYASLSGSSVATAVVTGALAANLSQDNTYRTLPRDKTRAAYAFKALTGMCRSLGLADHIEGYGVPML